PLKPGEQLEDKYGYFDKTQWYHLDEPFKDQSAGPNEVGQSKQSLVPIGKAGFSAWKEKPWSVELLPRKYGSTTVLGQDEGGRHYAYSKFTIEVDGKMYEVPIDDAQ